MKSLYTILLAGSILLAPLGAPTDKHIMYNHDQTWPEHFIEEAIESELFGLRFEIPDGWVAIVPSRLEDNFYFMITDNSHFTQDPITIWMSAVYYPGRTLEFVYNAIVANTENAADLLRTVGNEVESQVVLREGTTPIGSHEWYSIDRRLHILAENSNPSNARIFLRFDNDVVKRIEIHYADADQLYDILGMFRAM